MPVLPVNRNQAERIRLDKYKRCGYHQVIKMTVDSHFVNNGSFMGKTAGCLVFVVGKKIVEIGPGRSADQKNQEQETSQQLLYVPFCVHKLFTRIKDNLYRYELNLPVILLVLIDPFRMNDVSLIPVGTVFNKEGQPDGS
jgi:hypothetical protein